MTQPNMRRLANGAYLVRTQAGFRKALRECFSTQELPRARDVVGYPTAYPTVVSLEYVYGWNKATATCTPLNIYVSKLRDLVADLEQE